MKSAWKWCASAACDGRSQKCASSCLEARVPQRSRLTSPLTSPVTFASYASRMSRQSGRLAMGVLAATIVRQSVVTARKGMEDENGAEVDTARAFGIERLRWSARTHARTGARARFGAAACWLNEIEQGVTRLVRYRPRARNSDLDRPLKARDAACWRETVVCRVSCGLVSSASIERCCNGM